MSDAILTFLLELTTELATEQLDKHNMMLVEETLREIHKLECWKKEKSRLRGAHLPIEEVEP
jgi:hypothetical protein